MSPDVPTMLVTSPHHDERGWLAEIFNAREIEKVLGSDVVFVQDNLSSSRRGVVRGLHYQLPPHQQGKLVRVSRGAVFDVAVDIRKSSPGFGKWWSHRLEESDFTQVWVPPGFAHGFLSLADDSQVNYMVTAHRAPGAERRIRWDDPEIGIEWPLNGGTPILSAADRSAPGLKEAEVFE